MPSSRVADSDQFAVLRLEVIGQDSEDLLYFVRHCGLATETYTQRVEQVAVFDMGPPMHTPSSPGQMRVDVLGSAKLTDDECRKIENFIARHAGEHRSLELLKGRSLLGNVARMYCILPHSEPLLEEDCRYARTRFSCAGFVLEAYRFARISLVDLDSLPEVSWETVSAAYPDAANLIQRGRIDGESLGLIGEGKWPVLLCGYLFHSLNRDAASIRREPIRPTIDQATFP